MVKLSEILRPSDTDDADFIRIVENVLAWAVAEYTPHDTYLVHVRNWFDAKWLDFSGKLVGAVGVWDEDKTVPPFNPNRLVSAHHFTSKDGSSDAPPWLHLDQHSAENLQNKLRYLTTSGVFLWYSSNTTQNGRGSLMLYHTHDDQTDTWYCHLEKEGGSWRFKRAKGITQQEFSVVRQGQSQRS